METWYRENRRRFACGARCGPPQYPIRSPGEHYFVPVGGFQQHPNSSQDM